MSGGSGGSGSGGRSGGGTLSAETPTWKYEEYSNFSRQLAKDYTKSELEIKYNKLSGEQSKNTRSHLNAIERTASMQSQSQRRAQTGNVVRGNYEQRQFLKDALEIHKYYPNKSKK